MGGAMLRGWIAAGLTPAQVTVVDPKPADWLLPFVGQGLVLNPPAPAAPSVIVVAVKPQIMAQAVPGLRDLADTNTLLISIAAGTTIAEIASFVGADVPIIRAMPNTPAAVGAGITALVYNPKADAAHLDIAQTLMSAVGQTLVLDDEDQLHAVTGLSGSGPAYVFAVTEAMAAAGERLGLPAKTSRLLAVATVAGAGRLMTETARTPAELRHEVMSPNGTTQAGLMCLMANRNGIGQLFDKTISAAARRSRELSGK